MTGPSISLNALGSFSAEAVGDEPIVLMSITDATLGSPLRFSSHPTVRLSVEPLTYGTISSGITYEMAMMSTAVPDDKDTGPRKATLTLENVSQDRAAALRALTEGARANISIVLASAPDDVVRTIENLRILSRTYDAENVSLDLSTQPQGFSGLNAALAEPWPALRQTRDRAPGLHK